ncbi:breast carcinoma-amplified sequence 1 isoform X3 [Elephas maximus indicus]|uniref:breast carcinoma-amplified sequence 1 isoform X3 n=1 Tax=Elephas maximus indicus TaxID=99487 RepID=UPI002116317E|nr:breast carcinoma-amplified sequence 1 isoform X3 [Elephas maximus indicus]
MGNEMSVPQRVEDPEDESETATNQVASKNNCVTNGVPVIVSTCTIQHYDEVDLGISVQEDNVAASSPKTMEISSVADASGKNLGKEAKPEAPAAKSRFFLTLSRPVPGRARDQATDSSIGSVQLDVSSNKAPVNKAPSESMALPVAAAAGSGPDKTPEQTPAEDEATSSSWGPAPPPPESGGAAPSKPKDTSFFDKLFKLDKGRQKAPADNQPETRPAERQEEAAETAGLPRPSDDGPAEQDLVDSKAKEGQEITTWSSSVPEAPEELEIAKENPQTTNTTENNNSIMSFFKTLVSPNKAETKKDPEDTGAEKSPPTLPDPKSDKANFIPQEAQGAAKNPKSCNPPGHVPSAASTETAKEGGKEKAGPTSSPLGKLFWKKSIKEESVPTGSEENIQVVCESPVEITKSKEVDSALQTVDLNEDGDATPEPAEVKPKTEDSKPPRTTLMAFFRQMTSDSAEKATTPLEPELTTVVQKGKEGSSKDKKSPAEMEKQKSRKQEAKEPAPCAEQSVVEMNSLQNGDKPQKRPEKRRQSLGGFLKGLGPKRMLDAEVQTDPVSIGPVGKSK